MDLSLTEMWNQMGWFVKGIVLVMIAIVSLLDLGLGKLAFEVFTGADDV